MYKAILTKTPAPAAPMKTSAKTSAPAKTTSKTATNNAFCRVCMNAGKTEQEYRSHYTKNDKGIVLCPTILNATCTYCKTQGHFKKECPSLKAKEQLKTLKIIIPRNHYDEEELITTSAITTSATNPKKSYIDVIKQQAMSELFDDDDDDEEVVNAPARAPTPFVARKRRDIMHDWADDEYWSDSNEDFM